MKSLSRRIQTFERGIVGGQLLGTGRYLLLVVGVFGLFQFWFNNRPLPERIETKFSLTLPANARDFGWYDWSWDGYVTLAKFTVDMEDLEPTLQSVRWAIHDCLRGEREWDYMPEFYTDDSLSWWRPLDAVQYDGRSCYDYNPNGLAPNYNLMVDYSVPDVATVYIEEYSVDAEGRRALWQEIEARDAA